MRRLPEGGLLLVALLLLAAADLRVALRGSPEPLGAEALERARAALERLGKPGDHLMSSPLFTVAELAALGDRAGSPQLPSPAILRTRRVLLLEHRAYPVFGLPAGEVHPVPEVSALRVRIFQPSGGGEAVLFELRSALSPETLHVERGGQVTSRCTLVRGEGGYACPGEPEWLYAAERFLKIGGAESACVWAHPTNEGVMVFRVPPQGPPPPGRRLLLAVEAALADDAVNTTPDGALVRTEIQQGGQTRGTLSVPNRVGWQRTRVNVDPGQPIELRVTTPRDGRRHHCLNARVEEAPAEGP